jgi:hypothetical protein
MATSGFAAARRDVDGALEEEEDYSHGGHNFFDSQHVEEEEGSRLSGAGVLSRWEAREGGLGGRVGGREGERVGGWTAEPSLTAVLQDPPPAVEGQEPVKAPPLAPRKVSFSQIRFVRLT